MPSNPFKNEPSGTRLALNRIGLRVRNLERRFYAQAASSTPGVTVDSFYYDTSSALSVSSSETLTDGAQYLITVQGTYSAWNETLDVGTPEANAMFPGSTSGRSSTEVGIDADTLFACPSDHSHPIGHWDRFQIDLGSGFIHIEPDDGPHGTPSVGHIYQYTVTGQGSVASFRVSDVAFSDNYGKLFITVQALDGTTTGGGGGPPGSGSLVPPSDATIEHALLRVDASGVPAWETEPDITEADLSLTDVTTANVSTTQHGLTPKAPNDTTKALVGDGTWEYPTLDGGSA